MSEIAQVYVLMYLKIIAQKDGSIEISRPEPIVFDALPKLQQHIMDLVMKNIELYEERFASPLKKFFETKEFTRFLTLWRHAQLDNNKHTGFDAYWSEEPQVVL